MNIKYRKATPDDADRICYIVQHTKAEIYPDYYTKAVVDFFGRLHSTDNIVNDIEKGRISVLINGGNIVGTGSRTDNHITRVYVLPEFQGQGFGSMIMNELEKEIFAGYNYCELDASLPACIFYENRDFKTVKHVKYDIGNGNFMVYEIMRKDKPKEFIRECRNELILNINALHTTELSADRIRKNLNLGNENILEYCKKIILDTTCKIYKQGKNYYVEKDSIRITVNSSSFTIITAHKF